MVSAADFDVASFLLGSCGTWMYLVSGRFMTPNPDKLVSKALAVEHTKGAN